MSFPLEYAKLRDFVVRLGEKSRGSVSSTAFESTVASYVRILATVNQIKGEVNVPSDMLAELAFAYCKAGGKIYDAPGTPLRLLRMAGCK